MLKWDRSVPTSLDEVNGSFSTVEKLGIGHDIEVTQNLVHFEVIVRPTSEDQLSIPRFILSECTSVFLVVAKATLW